MAEPEPCPLRRSERLQVEIAVVVSHPRAVRRVEAELYDISPEGCRVVAVHDLRRGDELTVRIEGLDPWPARAMWRTH